MRDFIEDVCALAVLCVFVAVVVYASAGASAIIIAWRLGQ